MYISGKNIYSTGHRLWVVWVTIYRCTYLTLLQWIVRRSFCMSWDGQLAFRPGSYARSYRYFHLYWNGLSNNNNKSPPTFFPSCGQSDDIYLFWLCLPCQYLRDEILDWWMKMTTSFIQCDEQRGEPCSCINQADHCRKRPALGTFWTILCEVYCGAVEV